MSGGVVRECCRKFKDGQTDVHDEEVKDASLSPQTTLSNEWTKKLEKTKGSP